MKKVGEAEFTDVCGAPLLQLMITMTSNPKVHTFLPLPARGSQTPPPPYHQPVLIATYSHQHDRSIKHDDSSMAYYRQAPLGADLNYGFDRQTERDENVDEHLDGICEGLMELGRKGSKAERKGGIITWRGMITRYANLSCFLRRKDDINQDHDCPVRGSGRMGDDGYPTRWIGIYRTA